MVSSYYSLDVIKHLMKALKISQRQMASMIGRSRQSVNQWFQNRIPPRKYHLLAMSYVLDKYMEERNIIFDKYREQLILPFDQSTFDLLKENEAKTAESNCMILEKVAKELTEDEYIDFSEEKQS